MNAVFADTFFYQALLVCPLPFARTGLDITEQAACGLVGRVPPAPWNALPQDRKSLPAQAKEFGFINDLHTEFLRLVQL